MRTKVDEYKGFEIYFDTDSSKFTVEGCDRQQEKPSYNSAKKFINDFLKENSLFPEFKLVKNPSRGYGESEVIVQGLHSNGNLLALSVEKQEKFQLGSYNWDNYIFPEDLKKCGYNAKKVAELEEKRDKIFKEIREEENKIPNNTKEKINKIIEEFKYK